MSTPRLTSYKNKPGLYYRENDRGDKQWYKSGKLHRIDGPAFVPGPKSFYVETWWINDSRLDHKTFAEIKSLLTK